MATLVKHGIRVEAADGTGTNPKKLFAHHIDLLAVGEIGLNGFMQREKLPPLKRFFLMGVNPVYLGCNLAMDDDVIKRLDAAIAAEKAKGNLRAFGIAP
ncbi:MAG: hypothetical protein JO269_12890 [Burkholderiaceae bacterium]|nr:hypothetical protein [Burkholderiaceae bacterium]